MGVDVLRRAATDRRPRTEGDTNGSLPTARPTPFTLVPSTLLALAAVPPPAVAATLTIVCGTNPEIHALCRPD